MTLYWIGIVVFAIGFLIRFVFRTKYIASRNAGTYYATDTNRYRIIMNTGSGLAIIGLALNITGLVVG